MSIIYQARLKGGCNLKALQYTESICHNWLHYNAVIPLHYKFVGCNNGVIVWRDTLDKCYCFSVLSLQDASALDKILK